MAVRKFLFIDPVTGLYKEQTGSDTIQVADGVQTLDAVNKGQLDAAVAAASSSASAEEARALAAEAVLQSAIDAEAARALAAEGVLDGKIATEKSRAEAAEAVLTAAVATEKARAEAAEAGLAASVASEASARAAAVSAEAAARAAAIGVERDRALAAESDLQGQITQEIADRTEAVNAEAATRASAIAAEAARAVAIEDDLQSQISAEVSARTSAVSAEESRAMGVEASLQSELNTLNGADTLAGSVAYAVKTARAALETAISAEVSARVSAVSGVQSALDSEISRAQMAESGLAADIASEEARALAAEADLSSSISSEATARASAVAGLASDIAAEATARAAAVASVVGSLNGEISRAQVAESAIAADLAAEIQRAGAQEAGLSQSIANETTARIAGDASTLAAAKLYADGLSTGLKFKDSVRIALPTQFNLPPQAGGGMVNLPSDFANIKAMTDLADDDRVLLISPDEDNGAVDSGIYYVSGNFLLRSPDMKLGDDASGAYVYVEEGDFTPGVSAKGVGTAYVCSSTKGSDIVGSGDLKWAIFSRMENLEFGTAFSKSGQMVTLLAKSDGAIAIGNEGLALKVADTDHLATGPTGLELIGSLVDGPTAFADEEHSHSVIGFAANFLTATGAFVRANGTNASWENPDVLGFCKATFNGKSLIALSGVVESSGVASFASGATLYINGAGTGFVSFADVPAGKYAIPVAKKIEGDKIFVALGTALLKA